MISLRKAIAENSAELLHQTLESYRRTLGAVADACAKAHPPLEAAVKESLACLGRKLSDDARAEAIEETGEQIGAELNQWGEQARQYYEDKTTEIRDALMMVAGLASQVAERDQRNSVGLNEMTRHLDDTSKLRDLTEIRRGLLQAATRMKIQVGRMEKESHETVQKLRTQVAAYEARLEEAERLAGQDSLTGLPNRRAIENKMEYFRRTGVPFSILLMDLNHFKQVNDSFGHLAGDDVLRLFAQELRTTLRSSDVVGRWGGDEFIALSEGGLQEAEMRSRRIADWVNGEYDIAGEKVSVHAAVGIAAWMPGESILELLNRADMAMYRNKPRG